MHNNRFDLQCTLSVLAGLTLPLNASAADLIDLEPAGPVSHTINELLVVTGGLMLLVLIPVFVMTVWFAWYYRASNRKARYEPNWSESAKIEWLVWALPTVIVLVLTGLTWIYTHKLDPYKPLTVAGDVKPLNIQVVALDWKWLFIYPEQHVASINEVAFPAKRPVVFHLTSATVMNSFFIPRLAGQLYAMAGMETRLNLMADQSGQYYGENTQYSGRGFPFQHFSALALTPPRFDAWVEKARQSGKTLDMAELQHLAYPTAREPVSYYAQTTPGLFGQVMQRMMQSKGQADRAFAQSGVSAPAKE